MNTRRTRGAASLPPFRGALLLALAALATAATVRPAAAQEEVGTVAALEGTAQIGRAGDFQPAKPGAPIHLGDELRTGTPGRMRVVFRDDTILNLGDETRITVDDQVFAPDQGMFRASIQLLSGKVRALVGEYYRQPGASYELKTVTAVAGVRGTEFIVSYDPALELTRVVGVEGRVEVRSSRERIAQSVFVTSGELTEVDAQRAPEAPRLLDEQDQRRYFEGLDFVSVGTLGLAGADPVVAQGAVPAPDRAPLPQARAAGNDVRGHRDVSDLLGQPPAVVEKTAGGARIGF